MSFGDESWELWWNPVPFHVDLQDCCSATLTHAMLQSAVCSVLMTWECSAVCAVPPGENLSWQLQFREMRNPCWNSVCLSVKCHFSTGFLHNIFSFQCFFLTPSLKGWAPRAFCRANAANSAFLSGHNYIRCPICIQTEPYSDSVCRRLLSTLCGWKCQAQVSKKHLIARSSTKEVTTVKITQLPENPAEGVSGCLLHWALGLQTGFKCDAGTPISKKTSPENVHCRWQLSLGTTAAWLGRKASDPARGRNRKAEVEHNKGKKACLALCSQGVTSSPFPQSNSLI